MVVYCCLTSKTWWGRSVIDFKQPVEHALYSCLAVGQSTVVSYTCVNPDERWKEQVWWSSNMDHHVLCCLHPCLCASDGMLLQGSLGWQGNDGFTLHFIHGLPLLLCPAGAGSYMGSSALWICMFVVSLQNFLMLESWMLADFFFFLTACRAVQWRTL